MILIQAIFNLRPNAKWRWEGNDYENIEWLDTEQTLPTKLELETETQRIKQALVNSLYQRNRAAEYPSFADQFDTLYHGGYDAWKAQIDAIKLKYPKD
jgi:hypothetical protein